MKKTLLLFALLVSALSFSQSINDYQYVIVPEKFDFLKETNKYNLNVLTKMVFEKQGFKVYYPTEKLPDELALDKCKALYANLENDSGLLNTSLYLTLKDCEGKVVFQSEKGKSKIKDYKKAYYESLREASRSLSSLNYQYSGKNIVERANEIKKASQKEIIPATETVVAVNAIPVTNENQLFAQPISNGYQLVDMTPKVVLKMYKTSQPNSYTAQGEGKNGVVFKKDNEWFFEYYQNDKLISEKLNIKF